ncbi:hypothetical protein MTCD1_01223 [Colwellia marinimaniae]|uniref:Uncharacterized protein n=1 Tax=Colwellia marinimaniae TaxID=1513592 RepID=A0ABQ0MTD8_9GAMM|nr:hypothetical protein MTCD1_01223 [Colwellia marinimaniae]
MAKEISEVSAYEVKHFECECTYKNNKDSHF